MKPSFTKEASPRTVKIWEITFGDNWESKRVVADTIDEAMTKARKLLKLPDDADIEWISKAELIAEAT